MENLDSFKIIFEYISKNQKFLNYLLDDIKADSQQDYKSKKIRDLLKNFAFDKEFSVEERLQNMRENQEKGLQQHKNHFEKFIQDFLSIFEAKQCQQQQKVQKLEGYMFFSILSTMDLYTFKQLQCHKLPNYDEFAKIWLDCVSNNQSFNDKKFDLGQEETITSKEYFSYDKHYQFQKMQQNYEDGFVQGSLGNCYLICSLISLVSKNQYLSQSNINNRINNLFVLKQTILNSPPNICCFRFCLDGIWQSVYVDDMLMLEPDNNYQLNFYGLNFSQSTKDKKKELSSLWAYMIVKAYAKMYEGYHMIIKDYCGIALRELTGASCEVLRTKNFSDNNGERLINLIQKIAFALQNKKWICTALISKNQENLENNKYGLNNTHAYSVLNIYEIYKNNQQKQYLIIKDPLKEEIIKIPFSDAIKYFSVFEICHINNNYFYVSCKVENQSYTSAISQYFKINIIKKGEYYFSLVQQSRRKLVSNDPKYNYSYCTISLIKKEEQSVDSMQQQQQYNNNNIQIEEFQIIQQASSNYQETFIFGDLDIGEYIIKAKVYWNSEAKYNYVISCNGSSKTEIERCQEFKKYEFIDKQQELLTKRFNQRNKDESDIKEVEPRNENNYQKNFLTTKKFTNIEKEEGVIYYQVYNEKKEDRNINIKISYIDNTKMKLNYKGKPPFKINKNIELQQKDKQGQNITYMSKNPFLLKPKESKLVVLQLRHHFDHSLVKRSLNVSFY